MFASFIMCGVTVFLNGLVIGEADPPILSMAGRTCHVITTINLDPRDAAFRIWTSLGCFCDEFIVCLLLLVHSPVHEQLIVFARCAWVPN